MIDPRLCATRCTAMEARARDGASNGRAEIEGHKLRLTLFPCTTDPQKERCTLSRASHRRCQIREGRIGDAPWMYTGDSRRPSDTLLDRVVARPGGSPKTWLWSPRGPDREELGCAQVRGQDLEPESIKFGPEGPKKRPCFINPLCFLTHAACASSVLAVTKWNDRRP